MRRFASLFIVALLAGSAATCSDDGDSSETAAPGCTPGQQVNCACPGGGLIGVQRCNAVGFAQSPPEDWLNGIWSGGAARNGEGLVFEYVSDAIVGAAWFTHRPAPAPATASD